MINARIEGIASSKVFRPLVDSKRCAVFVDGFYEWAKEKRLGRLVKIPNFIRLRPSAAATDAAAVAAAGPARGGFGAHSPVTAKKDEKPGRIKKEEAAGPVDRIVKMEPPQRPAARGGGPPAAAKRVKTEDGGQVKAESADGLGRDAGLKYADFDDVAEALIDDNFDAVKSVLQPTEAPLVLAGLYDSWWDAERNEWTWSFAIITTPSENSPVEKIHDRMPLYLTEATTARWLDPSCKFADCCAATVAEAKRLAVDGLQIYEVDDAVSSIKNDCYECVLPRKRERRSEGIEKYFSKAA